MAHFKKLAILTLGLGLGLALPTIAEAHGFGAIAYSRSTGSFGWSDDFDSRYGAEVRALNGCRAYAGDCRVVVWVLNSCAALASGRTGGFGFAWHASRRVARSRALRQCRRNDRGCRIRKTIC